jgi:hypothetical protein
MGTKYGERKLRIRKERLRGRMKNNGETSEKVEMDILRTGNGRCKCQKM